MVDEGFWLLAGNKPGIFALFMAARSKLRNVAHSIRNIVK